MNIGDIYAGKPDANDEIREKGYKEFATNYIEPAGVSIDSLASTEYGTKIFIMGNKGTGKTALLNFLGNYVREQDPASCCSFISFENDYNQVQRNKFDVISQSISTSIKIDDSVASSTSEECDFTYIWKWQFYQKIIDDNTYFHNQLFVDDSYWNRFISEVGKIEKTIRQGKLVIPARISLTAETNFQIGTVTPGVSIEPVDLSKNDFSKSSSYSKFIEIIETAELLLKDISRTETPYYIFVDELEAYRGHGNIFYRDLRMIRDLLFVVKGFNDLFQSGTKVICSVRPEIITAINRFVMSRQLNKITLGFEERLNWEYTTTNSFDHPIMGVLLRRIQNSEERILDRKVSKKEIIDEWFTKNVFSTNICKYILDRTWYKPRDIIRLLLAAQANRSRSFSKFDQLAFQTFMPEYSKQCLVEIREEMRALYSEKEIDDIFSCMRGYNAEFSFQDIHKRAVKMYPQSAFATHTRDVLEDLYRVGVIGNKMMPRSKKRNRIEYKWAYKGVDGLIVDDTWNIVVHPALRTALTIKGESIKSLGDETPEETQTQQSDTTVEKISTPNYPANPSNDKANKIWSEIEIGKKYCGIVKSMTSYGAFVDIGGVDGMVHVTEISWTRINRPEDILTIGDKIEVYVINFDPEKKKISLGYRKPEDNPWNKFIDNFQEGDIVNVKIVRLTSFGAFAEIIPGIDGLIHISQIANYHVNSVRDELTIGQSVDTLITSINYENQKISLSIRALI